MSFVLSSGGTTWCASTSSATHLLSGCLDSHCAISASAIFLPSAGVFGVSLDTCTAVLLSHSLTTLAPLSVTGGLAEEEGPSASAGAARVTRARASQGVFFIVFSRDSIASQRRNDRTVLRAVAAEIAGLHFRWIAVPQAVHLVDQSVGMHVHTSIAEAVVRIEWVRAVHLY